MKVTRLDSISVQDFRSIGGRITVPLDAQVVLIHGTNGAGKTSVLSAIEFALTGSIDSLQRVDSSYLDHLVHRQASVAAIDLVASTEDKYEQLNWRASSDGSNWAAVGALTAGDGNFFKERCYLAQAVLGRLLEIYETTGGGGESALTRFVNDVLGLDAVEALIAGLYEAKDVRNTRRLIPGLPLVEREIEVAEDSLALLLAQIEEYEKQVTSINSQIAHKQDNLDAANDRSDASESREEASSQDDEEALTVFNVFRRDLESIRRRAERALKSRALGEVEKLEARAAAAASASDAWDSSSSVALEGLLDEVRTDFNDIPATAETSPSHTVAEALSRVQGAERASSRRVVLDDNRRTEEASLTSQLAVAESRLAVVNEQIAEEVTGSGELSRILSDLIPHLKGPICPVCGRSFDEVSSEPLSSHVAHRAARLHEEALHLEELGAARAEAVQEVSRLTDALAGARTGLMDPAVRAELIIRTAKLGRWLKALVDQVDVAAEGTSLRASAAAARRSLADYRQSSADLTDLRAAVTEIAESLGESTLDATEPIGDHIARLVAVVDQRAEATTARVTARRQVAELSNQLLLVKKELAKSSAERVALDQRLVHDRARRAALEVRRIEARELRATALKTRDAIVRSVFSDSLNHIWRDLFKRLAPDEPFVPAFRFDSSRSTSTPRLSTEYEGGQEGGNPGSMLSAGNLNTAALTLFLALHLSAQDRLPMLILDDPVQSMDDLHISQFAALLRTLVRQHGRQVVIAVHERALFDYLAFELTPSTQGERLITVELSKGADGRTRAEPAYRDWQKDPISVIG